MIQSIFYFLLFSALFYTLYKALLANKSFFASNRALLLAIPLLSAGIAFIGPRVALPSSYPVSRFVLPEIQIASAQGGMDFSESAGFADVWLWLYLAIAAVLLLYTILGLVNLYKILNSSEQLNGHLYLSANIKSAFNFAHGIVIPARLNNSKNYHSIVLHEEAHRQQLHYLDNLYYRLLSIVAWFNPFIHLLGKELKQVHECQADAAVIEQENIENYAHTLLSSTLGGDIGFPVRALPASPFFNSSLIKTRITMIYKNKSPKWQRALYLSFLPLMVGMTLLACNKTDSTIAETPTEKVLNASEVDYFPRTSECADATKEASMMCFQQAIMKHVSENLSYPEEAKKLGMEGKIYVGFVVSAEGHVSEVEIKRGLAPAEGASFSAEQYKASESANSQIITLLQGVPAFEKSAIKEGNAVAMEFTLPIALKLPKSTDENAN